MRQISEHFTLNEVERSRRGKELGIDNTMPAIYYQNAINLAKYILEPIREQFGAFSPHSWYRSKQLNAAIGGNPNSQHLIASAADLVHPKTTNLELATWIRDNLVFDQLILENGWVHCSWVKAVCRQEVLRWDGKDYYKGLE